MSSRITALGRLGGRFLISARMLDPTAVSVRNDSLIIWAQISRDLACRFGLWAEYDTAKAEGSQHCGGGIRPDFLVDKLPCTLFLETFLFNNRLAFSGLCRLQGIALGTLGPEGSPIRCITKCTKIDKRAIVLPAIGRFIGRSV